VTGKGAVDGIRLTFLGTGTSHGIPVIGCDCVVCQSPDPRNQRYRPSVLIEQAERTILIDTPPELRLQLLRSGTKQIDALLLTHTHADHIFGLDDVRVFNQRTGKPMPIFASAESLANVRRQFFYAFADGPVGGGKPALDLQAIEPLDSPFEALGVPVQPVPVLHGPTTVLGYRFGRVAYVTDTNFIGPASLDLLGDLDVLVLDALRESWHPTHFSLDEALEVIRQLRPARSFLTHICHDVDHQTVSRRLPPNVELAYDTLVVESAP
jgi:phosphoribosyl 1,2-cyclic phosphate phosphodiesterase